MENTRVRSIHGGTDGSCCTTSPRSRTRYSKPLPRRDRKTLRWRRAQNQVGDALLATGEDNYKIEQIQDEVERVLMHNGLEDVAKRYILYRAKRARAKEVNTALMQACDEITNADARRSNLKRDNANVDGNASMGSMLQLGSAAAKSYNTAYLLTPSRRAPMRKDGFTSTTSTSTR